jgi:hypothetical protein
MTKRIYGLSGAVGLATLAMLSGARLRAQTPAFDARWQAWLGCWQPSDAAAIVGAKPSGVCVSPINASSAVEVTTVQDGAVTARDTIDASGVERHVDKQGCVGTQTGQWSADARRVFVHSAMSCAGGLSRTGNAIIAMTPYGDWVNVQTLTVGKTTGVRAMHYRDANSLKIAPPEVANAIGNRQLAINAARTEAGAPIDVPAVLEAVHRTDTTAVESWIIERGTKFNLDAKQLVALADAGIPSSVTDVMIGVSYPDHFALKPSTPAPGIGGGYATSADAGYADRTNCAALTSGYARSACLRCRDSWNYDSLYGLDSTDCGLGYRYGSLYSPFGYPIGYGAGYGYGYPYYPYYGYSTAPVVVVKGDDQPHGRVVNGHGYTQHPSSGAGTSGSTSSGSSGSYSGSGSGASTSSAPSSGSSGGGGGEVRTAHPRPPM